MASKTEIKILRTIRVEILILNLDPALVGGAIRPDDVKPAFEYHVI